MAELDYAFLADFARVEPNGTLTAVGASWTHLWVTQLPSVHRMAIAGRVRAAVSEGRIPVRVEIIDPEGSTIVSTDFGLEAGEGSLPYDGDRLGHLFAIETVIPIVSHGKFKVSVILSGDRVRDLFFEVGEKAT